MSFWIEVDICNDDRNFSRKFSLRTYISQQTVKPSRTAHHTQFLYSQAQQHTACTAIIYLPSNNRKISLRRPLGHYRLNHRRPVRTCVYARFSRVQVRTRRDFSRVIHRRFGKQVARRAPPGLTHAPGLTHSPLHLRAAFGAARAQAPGRR